MTEIKNEQNNNNKIKEKKKKFGIKIDFSWFFDCETVWVVTASFFLIINLLLVIAGSYYYFKLSNLDGLREANNTAGLNVRTINKVDFVNTIEKYESKNTELKRLKKRGVSGIIDPSK